MRRTLALILLAACADHPMSKTTELVTPPAPTARLQTATFALG